MKHIWTAIVLLLLTTIPLFSQDEPEGSEATQAPEESAAAGGYQLVEGLETWHHEIDISGYPAGTYNIVIEGVDKAGNVTQEGPFDVYIDPDSDKPVVNISNPKPGMKVNGNLNIIGTCVDDDGVSGVEIKIDDGVFRKAEGTDFWSFFLETEKLSDGPHTVSARGTDINGLPGEEQSVGFILDRSVPRTKMTSIQAGALVHDRVVLEGISEDPNGIEKIEFSTDGQLTYQTLYVRNLFSDINAEFSLRINTRDLQDGPQIYWFKATDQTGSVGFTPFLFFVDNQAPQLEIIYPAAGDSVNGKFIVAGFVADEIGIEKLEYRKGREVPVEIPLSVGDPYWFQEFDFSGQQKADISFILTDKTGNIVEKKVQYVLDAAADKPLIELLTPEENGVSSKLRISGWVSDDDAVASVVYSIDGGEAVTATAGFSFDISPPELNAGLHKIEIYAVDTQGIRSDIIKRSFSVIREQPAIKSDKLIPVEGDSSEEFIQAMVIDTGIYKSFTGQIQYRNQPKVAFYSVDDGEELKLPLSSQDSHDPYTSLRAFSVPLAKMLPGYHSIKITTTDDARLSSTRIFYLMIVDPAAGSASKQLYSADSRFSNSGKPVNGLVRLTEKDDQVVFFLDGEKVKDAVLSENADFLRIVKDGSRVILKTASAGYAENVQLTITAASGKAYNVGPFNIGADDALPVLNLTADPAGKIISGDILIAGQVTDNVGLQELKYSLNGGEFKSIPVEEGSFSVSAALDKVGDGGVLLTVMAVDRLGNQAQKTSLFKKDTAAPDLQQIIPLKSMNANGVVKFLGRVADKSPLQSIEYSTDGENYTPVDNSVYPSLKIDLTSGDSDEKKHIFRLTDTAGNVSETELVLKINTDEDTPAVAIQIPENDVLVKSDFVISGMAFDDDQVASIQYSIDGGEFTEIGSGNNFEIPVSIADISDNNHYFEVKAVDLNGVESEPDRLNVNVSKNEPLSVLQSPDIDAVVRGEVLLTGTSEDMNGISRVLISYDNGNTFNLAEVQVKNAEVLPEETPSADAPAEETSAETVPQISSSALNSQVSWSYDLNTELLEDGSHSLLIKAVDNFGVEGLYTTLINIDNTDPVIEITGPREGEYFAGEIELKGKLSDNIELAEVRVDIQNLSSEENVLTKELPLDEILIQKIDLSDFPQGWINMRITAVDKTGNSASVSRNILKQESREPEKVSILFPSTGSQVTGSLDIAGRIENFIEFKAGRLIIDDGKAAAMEIDEAGYFSVRLERGDLSDGLHKVTAIVENSDGESVSSEILPFEYSSSGPWIQIDNFKAGNFAVNRPWLEGTAGYEGPEPENKKDFEVKSVEISLDNGKTFKLAKGGEAWKFRLETQEMETGELWVLARALFRNGSTAVTKTMVIVDASAPAVELLSPREGARFNGTLNLVGTADDEYGLESVSVALREGTKSSYQVPSFIQGLYIDAHFMGATYAELGVGLTFFDDNVKLQALVGMAPPGRFTGMTLGIKLLANIAVLPWEYFFGYDFKDISSSFAVGTTFEYFSMPDVEGQLFGSNGIVLGAMIAQAELVKYKIPELKMFSSYSAYTEMQLWFISSDVDAGVEPRITFGLRADVF